MSKWLSLIICSVVFTLLAACSASQPPQTAANQQPVRELVEALPADNFVEGEQINIALLEHGSDGYVEVCRMLVPPGTGDDTKARYALSEAGKYVSRSGAEAERQEYVQAIIIALEKRPHPEVAAFLINQLKLTGKEESVAQLSYYLTDDRLSDPAARALVSINSPKASKALLAALTDDNYRNHLTLIKALGEMREKAAIEKLTPFVENRNADIREAAVWALANIGDQSASKTILEAAGNDADDMQISGVFSYELLFAKRLAEDGNTAKCVEISRRLAQKTANNSPQVQSAALGTLVKVLGQDALDDLLAAMDSQNPQVRSAALMLAADIPGEAATALWIDKMKSASPQVQAEIVSMLGNRGDLSATPALLAAMSHSDPLVSTAAIPASAKLGKEAALPAIIETLKSTEDRSQIENIQQVLAEYPSEQLLPPVAAALPSATPAGQVALLEILAERGGSDFKEDVFALADAEERRVRSAAIKSYGKLADADDFQRCIDLLLNAETKPERLAAERAVVAVSQKIEDQKMVENALLAAFDASDDAHRESVMKTMGSIGGEAFLSKTIEESRNSDVDRRVAAVRALSEWDDPQASGALLEIINNSPAQKYKTLALRGYVRLTGMDSTLTEAETIEQYQFAMGQAENTAEKRIVLSGISAISSPATLQFAAGYLKDPDILPEAEAAVLKIGTGLQDHQLLKTGAALREIAASAESDTIRQLAIRALQYVAAYEDHILVWEYSGPYSEEGADLFDSKFLPETDEYQNAQWQLYPVDTDPENPWRVSLDKAIGGDDRVVYLRNKIWSAVKQEALIECGSDDALKIWLNGKPLHENDVYRGAYPGDDRVRITLEVGWNPLMLKVINGSGGWAACLRFRNTDGGKLDGLKVETGGEVKLEPASVKLLEGVDIPLLKTAETLSAEDLAKKYDGTDDYKNQPPDGFIALFNGTDLNGWKGLVQDPPARAKMNSAGLAVAQMDADEEMLRHWSVADGILVFDGKGHSLCTEKDYQDFELLVDWKIGKDGDSGIYLRGAPQVQIWDPAQWPEGSGGLYNNQKNPNKPLVAADNAIGGWNRFRIIMIGERVTVYLNNILVVDDVVMENYWERDKPIYPIGQIELQSHDSPLFFRNIFIREIKAEKSSQPVALYNGKDLSGWQLINAREGSWHAAGEILYVEGEGGGWISTDTEYQDFKLEFDFRVPSGGNSGVFLRAPHSGDPAYTGMEVQVLDDDAEKYANLKPWQYTGSIYAVQAPSRRATKPAGEWQKMRIICEGPRVQVFLNGEQINDVDIIAHMDKEARNPGLKRRMGFVGFQNHGDRVEYRNIYLTEL